LKQARNAREPQERLRRLFVAIEPPDAWLTGLGELQEGMKAAFAAHETTASLHVRWVRPETMHLTLKFIGEVAPTRVEAIEAQLAKAVPGKLAMTLSLLRAGSFSDRRAPRVIWAGIGSKPETAPRTLAESIETCLATAGVPRERRGFTPHLTLARLPQELNDAQRLRAAAIASTTPLPELASFEVERISLIESFLSPHGASYERVAQWPL
jgi:RNA 2',3'-cyclic 3'-phosphodiesterase